MIRINLLPFRAARKRENIRRQITIFILVIFLFLTAMVYFFINLNGKLSNLTDQQGTLKNELASYKKELNEIRNLQNKIKEIKTKLTVIKRLEADKTGPVLLLSELADAVPKGRLWLNSLVEKKGRLILSGTAMDNETVALFMKNLEEAKQITAPPELTSSTRRLIKKYNLTVSDFVMQCRTHVAGKKARKKKSNKKK